MITQSYDTIILGSGPAGCNLARLLRSTDPRVLLIDGSAGRAKVCAGLISPDAQKLLRRYGLSLPDDVLRAPQLRSVRVIDVPGKRVRHYPRTYINVDRAAFDRFLLELVPPTVTVMQARCCAIASQTDGYLLTLRMPDGTEHTVSARRIVGADGASSLVRRTLFKEKLIQKYVSIQQTFHSGNVDPYYSCIFDPATSESCSWIFFKGDHMVFGGAFPPRGCRAAFEKQKRRLMAGGLIEPSAFDAPISTEACLVSRPHLTSGVFLGNETAFLIGEAAGFISPSSFEGISYALSSSEALAKAIHSSASPKDTLRRYHRETRLLRLKILGKCLKRPWMYLPALRALVMKSGIGSIKKEGGV